MNRNVLRALAADAFHQVLDNGVFRILAVLTALPILLTFVIGLREEGIVLLFGLKTWSYADLLGPFGSAGEADPRGILIEAVLQIVLDFLAGNVGMLLCLSATAFFVPRMLEKGAAELYFHKPVSRATLFLSRYFAGLLFITLVAVVLVGGMFLGLWLVSGHRDLGILAGIFDLVYVFALIYSFSMLVGVLMRSTVAALLLPALFFLFNGCIHQSWIQLQQLSTGLHLDRHDEPAEIESVAANPAAPTADEHAHEEGPAVLGFLRTTLDALHLLLPKTTDATYFTKKLRRALEPPEFRDDDSLVCLGRLPEDCARMEPAALAALLADDPLRGLLGEPRLGLDAPGGTRGSLWRRPLQNSETRIGERVHTRPEGTSQAGKKLEEALRAAGASELARETTHLGSGRGPGSIEGTLVRWQESAAPTGTTRTRSAIVFRGNDDEFLYTLLVDSPGALAPEAAKLERERLTGHLGLDLGELQDWYPRQLGIRAPLRYNVLFSIGSSLAFAVLMLGLGIWRLGRIDF